MKIWTNLNKLISAFAIIFAISVSALAAAPANDNLSGSESLQGNTGSVVGTTLDATRENGEYDHSDTTVLNTVWYSWSATENKPVTFEISAASFDTNIAVYTGNNFPLSTVTWNNDSIGNKSRVSFKAVAGTIYRIAVGVFDPAGGAAGSFNMSWHVSDFPVNDNFANATMLPAGLSGSVSATNQNAVIEVGEPVHYAGSSSVWYTFVNNSPYDYSMRFVTRRFATAIDTTIAVYTGSSLDALTPVVKNDNQPATSTSEARFLARSGVTYRIALDGGSGSDQWSAILDWNINPIKYYTEFNTDFGQSKTYYDNAADITIFRPSDGTWWIRNSHIPSQIRAVHFGMAGDTPVQGDYDGDGTTDLAVARDTANGKIWYIANSIDQSYTILQWGLTGDKPVTGDYDGDGRVDVAVFRPSNGTWYIRKSTDGTVIVKQFGLATDIPVMGDFKGTPRGTDIAVFRPSNGTWYILNGDHTIFIPFGMEGDIPVVSDYEKDDYADVAVYRPSTGQWYVRRSRDGQVRVTHWGLNGDIPMTGDYDNNSNDLDDYAVFRPSDSQWYILSAEGTKVSIFPFGLPGDIPASSPNMLSR